MAERDVDILIIGGGLAGASCAEGLREEGFDGSVLLVGREPHPPYQRPPCSKDLLRGESEPDDAHLHPDEWYGDNNIELLTRTSVLKLDPAAKTAELAHKTTVRFDRALLATGANINRLRVEGGDHDGIHYLRTLGTSVSLREDAKDAERVVLIGGSYIACEVAASLTALGKQCTLVMLEDAPLSTGFGTEAGGFFQDLLGSHGIEFVTGDGVARFEGEKRVERVVTDSGKTLDADLVVIGAGAHPDVMLARSAGLELGETGGVKCSSDAGDVGSRHLVRGRPVRVRLRRPPAAAAGRALRGRRGAGHVRGVGDDGRPGALRRGALLLVRPRRLDVTGVRRAGGELGPRGRARLVRRRRVHRLLPRRQAGRRRPDGRALRRPRAGEGADGGAHRSGRRRPQASQGSRRAAARTGRRRARGDPRTAGRRGGSTRRRSGARSRRGPSAGRARW